MSIYLLTLPRPGPWAVRERSCRVLFFTSRDDGRPQALRPPVEALGRYVALQVGSAWDVEGAAFMERRLGLCVPAEDGLPARSIFAVARLTEVTTLCNDSRAFGGEPWSSGPRTVRDVRRRPAQRTSPAILSTPPRPVLTGEKVDGLAGEKLPPSPSKTWTRSRAT